MISDGGEPANLSLFWGESDGGSNMLTDPLDASKWDYRIDLNDSFSTGGFNYFVDGLEKNQTYYYRWMGGNSVSPQVWSTPTQDGLIQWWKFDENGGSQILNQISERSGTLVGINDSDRIFGHEGKALKFDGDGGHVVIKTYKGIVGSNSRTLSFWLKTSDANASLVSWGSNADGEMWEISLENGKLKLDIGGGIMLGASNLDNDLWNHVAITLPTGSPLLSDCTLYLNGEVDTAFSSQFNLNPTFISPDIWLDASDFTSMDQGTSPGSLGSPSSGDSVQFWNDKTGNGYNAVRITGTPILESNLNSNYPGINTSGDSFEIVNSAVDFDQLSAMSITFVVDWLNTNTGDKMIWKGNGTGWWKQTPTFWIGKFNTGAGQGTGIWYAQDGSNYFKINGNTNSDARSETKIITVIYDGNTQTNLLVSNGYEIATTNGVFSSLPSSSDNIRIGGGHKFGDIILAKKAFTITEREYIEGYLAHKYGLTENLNPSNPYADAMDYIVHTGSTNDLVIGTNEGGNHLNGIVDELRIYDRGLSQIEVKSIALDGTIAFRTSSVPRPPAVEIIDLQAEANATVSIRAELTSKDENLPSVSIFYGRSDGGFDSNAWEHNQTLFGGNTVPLGEFNGSISGLIPGEKYYFRVFAESADGTDWSSGAPEVDQDLMAYWRMDESNGTLVYDSVYPLYTAQIQGLNADKNRSASIQGNGITLDGWSNSIDIDLANTGYLNSAFDGRSFSA